MEELLREKNRVLLELEHAKKSGAPRRQCEILASRVATLESRLADQMRTRGRHEDAAINLVSAASCLRDAHRPVEAVRILNLVLGITTLGSLQSWIRDQLSELRVDRVPAQGFDTQRVHILDNPNLRIPQREAYMAARRHFGHSNDHAIIQLPVGCGKTGTMAILPFGLARGRTLVIAPNLEITQTVARSLDHSSEYSFYRRTRVLENGAGPTCAVLASDANVLDCDTSDFVVTNIQQLVARSSTKWLDRLPSSYFDMILVDEGHHNVADSWQQVFERFPFAKVASFTATPFRSDGQELHGRRIYRFPISAAIREGYVRDLCSRRLEPREIYFEYRGSSQRLTLEQVLKLREEAWFSRGVALARECNVNIVDASIQCMRELRAQGQAHHQIIAAACSIDHARVIRSLYAERNCSAEVIHSGMSNEEQDDVRRRLERGQLDAVVHVQMLGEGADYPNLGIAAVFRPYRHLVPYVQFVGRIMRVTVENAPGHPDNRGYVVSHVGLNIDRWWDELRRLDEDDQMFFEQLTNAERSFLNPSDEEEVQRRRRFRPAMQVLEEVVERFVEVGFLEADSKALVDDVIQALQLRGVSFDTLGLSRRELEQRLLSGRAVERVGAVARSIVQPQKKRQEARKRLGERVRAGAKELLNELGLKVTGYELPRLFPEHQVSNNVAAAIILLNLEVQRFLGTSSEERDILSADELERAHEHIDELIDRAATMVHKKMGQGDA